MPDTYLILDCNYLLHRAYHAMPDLSFEGMRTGVFFGFFRDVVQLQEIHNTGKLLFTFDGPGSAARLKVLPSYKESRRKGFEEADEDEKALKREFRASVKLLREKILRAIGFRNIFVQPGYEADDIIASLCATLPRDSVRIIVTSDNDMFQLLSDRVMVWNPRKGEMVTKTEFEREHKISPGMWPLVKSIAGDSADDIPGVSGVGLKKAAQWVSVRMNPASATWRKIAEALAQRERNMKLIELPFPGTQEFAVVPDEVTEENWNRAMEKLGIKTLMSGRTANV